MKALQYHFSKDEYVSFDVDFEHQKVQEIGQSVFLLLHGDIPKANIKTILQREGRKEYGRTTHAYVLLGHVHHCVVNDEGGVMIMSLPSPTDPDYWHKQQSYGGNWRGTYCFIVDHKKGITDTWHIGTK